MSRLIDRVAGSTGGLVLLLGRLAMAAIFLPSGFNKLMHLATFAGSLASRGVPVPYVFAILGAFTEFFGSICVILGFKTRYAALLMAVFTGVAAYLSHHFWDMEGTTRAMQYTQFMKNLSIIGGFLLMFAAGPGPYSVDRRGR
jgi:putative oxidoreductase